MMKNADLLELGSRADELRKDLHPEGTVTFVIDRNINYTNICINKCRFCAFYRDAGSPDAYVLSKAEIFRKIEETIAQGGTQIRPGDRHAAPWPAVVHLPTINQSPVLVKYKEIGRAGGVVPLGHILRLIVRSIGDVVATQDRVVTPVLLDDRALEKPRAARRKPASGRLGRAVRILHARADHANILALLE